MALTLIAIAFSFAINPPLCDGPNAISSKPWKIIHLLHVEHPKDIISILLSLVPKTFKV